MEVRVQAAFLHTKCHKIQATITAVHVFPIYIANTLCAIDCRTAHLIMRNKVSVLETAQKPDLLHAPAQCGAALALNYVDVAGGAAVDG